MPGVRSNPGRQTARADAPAGPARETGYPRTSLLESKVNAVVAHVDRVHRDRLDGRHAEWPAGPDVEPGAMTRTLDLAADQFALGERAPVVGAHVVDGVDGAVDVEDRDRPAVELDQFFRARR